MAVTDTLAEVSSEVELRELLGTPVPRVIAKERTRLHGLGPRYEQQLYG
jgi:hypothetical protein